MELNQAGDKPEEQQVGVECNAPMEENIIEKEIVQMDARETAQNEPTCVEDPAPEAQLPETPYDISNEQKDEILEVMIKETEKFLEGPVILEEVNSQLPTESPAKPAERRQSLRLSAIHKAATANATPKAPSKLGQSFITKPEMKRSYPQKENVNPAKRTAPSNIPVKVNSLRPLNKTAFVPSSKPSKKPKFDIKESLKRPLTYKPHTGPLPKLS